MNEWDFDQRLRELERKALFKKMNLDAMRKCIPPLLLFLGSIGLLCELNGTGPKVAAGFLTAGSYLLMIFGLME
jgi:hypothetical protein